MCKTKKKEVLKDSALLQSQRYLLVDLLTSGCYSKHKWIECTFEQQNMKIYLQKNQNACMLQGRVLLMNMNMHCIIWDILCAFVQGQTISDTLHFVGGTEIVQSYLHKWKISQMQPPCCHSHGPKDNKIIAFLDKPQNGLSACSS